MSHANELYRIIQNRLEELGLNQADLNRRVEGAGEGSSIMQNIRRGAAPSFARLSEIAKALDLEFYFGPHRMTPTADMAHSNELALLDLYDVEAATGAGSVIGEEHCIARLAFDRDWLRRLGVAPKDATLIYVRGDSMKPTIQPGATVLVDRARTEVRDRHVYVFGHRDLGLFVKRLQHLEGRFLVRSDNPFHGDEIADFDGVTIIGEVLWSGHDIPQPPDPEKSSGRIPRAA